MRTHKLLDGGHVSAGLALFSPRPSVSCLLAWETKTRAREKRRRLPSRSRNQNPDASAKSSRRRPRRSSYRPSRPIRVPAQEPAWEAVSAPSSIPFPPTCRRRATARFLSRFHQAKGHPDGMAFFRSKTAIYAQGCTAAPWFSSARACAFSAKTLCALFSRAWASGMYISAF